MSVADRFTVAQLVRATSPAELSDSGHHESIWIMVTAKCADRSLSARNGRGNPGITASSHCRHRSMNQLASNMSSLGPASGGHEHWRQYHVAQTLAAKALKKSM